MTAGGGNRPITFVTATPNRGEVLQNNFLASDCFKNNSRYQVLIQENFKSAAEAYNEAFGRAANDLIVFAHNDVIFPPSWICDLEKALSYLEVEDPNWGVLGCYGVTLENEGRGYLYSPGRGVLGKPFEHPQAVQTLDEIVLVTRKSSGLHFDTTLPHFHLYGADLCLRAAQKGMKSYAISAFVVHNAHQYFILPDDFYDGCQHLRRVWKAALPVQTPCIRLTQSNVPLYKRRLREAYLKHIKRKSFVIPRMTDVPHLMAEAEASRQ